jgi:hypothetical protein
MNALRIDGVRFVAGLLTLGALASCREDGEPAASRGSDGTATSAAPPPTDSGVADSTGAPLDPACIDDYHGNQLHQTALDLALDTTDTAFIVLGDGFVASPLELGSDELVVCDAAVSDFFVLQAQCPGYLAIEARKLEGSVPDLYLYDDSFEQSGQPIAQAVGDWSGFFLKPLQRQVDAGSHVIEVRHSGGGPERYSLTVILLPDSPCPP